MLQSKFIKRAQSRLSRINIKLSAQSLRKIFEVLSPGYSEINEENFEQWYFTIKSIPQIHSENANEYFENLTVVEQENSEEENLESSENELEDSEPIFYSQDVLNESLKYLNLEISTEDYQIILKGLKTSFDNQQECVEAIYEALENYVKIQELKRQQLLANSQELVQNNLINVNSDVQKLQQSLSNYQEKNYELVETISNIQDEYAKLKKVKNLILTALLTVSGVVLFLIPYNLKMQQTSYQNYLQGSCQPGGNLSSKLCQK